MKKAFILFAFVWASLLVMPFQSRAQFDDIATFLQGSTTDAELLMQAYLEPYADGMGSGLSTGWVNTAKPHKLLGFDLTVSGTGIFVPDEMLTFDAGALGMTTLEPTSAAGMAPTAAGDGDGITLQTIEQNPLNGEPLFTMNSPDGTGMGTLLVPSVKLGIGLIKGTEVMVKYFPTVSISDAELGLWGVGVMHSLKQYIPFVKRVPMVHLSVMAGYTQFNASSAVSFTPENLGNNVVDATSTVSFDDQQVDLAMSSFTANLMASVNAPVISAYAGLGVVSTNAELALLGYYPTSITVNTANGNLEVGDAQTTEDPINLEFGTDATDGMVPKATLGARIKMAVITLHAEYTYSTYSMVNAGLGISFR